MSLKLLGQRSIGQIESLVSLLSIIEVNVNLAATYFCGQEQMGQINFHKKLAKILIFNTHYNKDNDKTQEKKQKQ